MADELKDQRIPIMMTASEVKAVDDWMFGNRERSRGAAIRFLINRGLMFRDAMDVVKASVSAIDALENNEDAKELVAVYNAKLEQLNNSIRKTIATNQSLIEEYEKILAVANSVTNNPPED